MFKCDRCGNSKVDKTRVNFKIKNRTVEDVAWVTLRCATGYQMTLDLCKDCMRDFSIFMEGDGKDGDCEP